METDSDDEGPTFKERMTVVALEWLDILCVWDCCPLWNKFRDLLSLLVFDPFVELFITLCIVVNTLFMALDHHEMNKTMEAVLQAGNYVISFFLLLFLTNEYQMVNQYVDVD